MWACRALKSRHVSHFRVLVSSSAVVNPNCGNNVIVRFRPSQDQMTPHEHDKGKKFCQRRDVGTVHLNACREARQRRRILHCFPPQSSCFLPLSSLFIHLWFFTSNSATIIRHHLLFAHVFARSALFSLPSSVSFLASFSLLHDLHLRRGLLCMKQPRQKFFRPSEKIR